MAGNTRSRKGMRQAWSPATLKRRPEEAAKKDGQNRRKAEQVTEDAKRTVLRREVPTGSKAAKGLSQVHVGFFTGELNKHRGLGLGPNCTKLGNTRR